jgi:hypothetical protein
VAQIVHTVAVHVDVGGQQRFIRVVAQFLKQFEPCTRPTTTRSSTTSA